MDTSSNQQWRATKQEALSGSDVGHSYTFQDLLAELYSTDVSSTNQVDLTEHMRENAFFSALREVLIERKEQIRKPLQLIRFVPSSVPYEYRNELCPLELYDNENFGTDVDDKSLFLDAKLNECFAQVEQAAYDPSSDVDSSVVQLANLREEYWTTQMLIQQNADQATGALKQTLRSQQTLRPITEHDVSTAVEHLQTRVKHWENELKTATCNQAILLRSLQQSGKRTRKNFPKAATKVLSDYFEAHMDEPYPDDETKNALAKQCGLTPAQISNWFGNKRIRFRRSLQAEKKVNAT
ncbi:homeobox protein extradenticle-like [Aphelenchoides avenae]|nr:homeobox protein extradenticle-like [Aphelenchus avenae]